MLNRIISVKLQYQKFLYRVALIELLVLHSNTWNNLTVCKWMNSVEEDNYG